MSGKSDKDKQKALQEKHQAILNELLKEKCNTYCVDCNCKGPRWASWNLGVFLCIRCAGIHRNLGVHISKVKSVNLDSWTVEQIAMMQRMGNAFAKSVYEANLPANFPIPQTDSALEALIRAKYEYKKYMAKDSVHVMHKVESSASIQSSKKEKKHRNRSLPPRKTSDTTKSWSADTSPAVERKNKSKEESKSDTVELLTLDIPESQTKADPDFRDFLCIDDRPADTGNCDGDVLAFDLTNLDLIDYATAPSESTRLPNDAILALYGPPNAAVFPGIPGGMYVPQQATGLYTGGHSNGFVGSSSSFLINGSGVNVSPVPSGSGANKNETAALPSPLTDGSWCQPSTVGRTLCTSLWQ